MFGKNSLQQIKRGYRFYGIGGSRDKGFAFFTKEKYRASGVALAYKLLSLEYLSKVKERFFASGLKSRLKLFARYLELVGNATIDTGIFEIVFNRNLPINNLEVAQVIQLLSNKVSLETLLTQIPFVKNIPDELETVKLERQENAKNEADAMLSGNYPSL